MSPPFSYNKFSNELPLFAAKWVIDIWDTSKSMFHYTAWFHAIYNVDYPANARFRRFTEMKNVPAIYMIWTSNGLLWLVCITQFSEQNHDKANLRVLIAATATGLVILLRLDSNHRFFRPCDLEIWWMTSKNIRAPLPYYIKLCASIQGHRWPEASNSFI